MFLRLLLFCIGVVISLSAQTGSSFTEAPTRAPQPPIEMAHDSHVRTLLSNSSAHVYRIDLEPGAETAIDRHEHDFLVLSLGNSEFDLAGSGNVYPMTMNDGEVQVMKGHWPHRVVNKGRAPLHLIEIESVREIQPENAICGLGAQSCTGAKFAKDDQTNYVESTLFITPSMRLAKIQIEPALGMPEHGHTSAHLMIALNDQRLSNAVVAGQSTSIEVHAGDPTWFSGDIVHRLVNKGTQSARFLTIEWR